MQTLKRLFIVFCLSFPTALRADCGALQPLVMIHDGYRALASEPNQNTAKQASDLLLRLVPIYNAEALNDVLSGMDLDIDTTRLNAALNDGFMLARNASRGLSTDFERQATHERNANWLSDLLTRSGCFRDLPTTANSPRIESTSATPTARSTPSPKSLAERFPSFDARILAAIFLGIALVGLVFGVLRSKPVRRRRVARQPRQQIALVCDAVHEDEPNTIIVLDISLGGAKVEWKDPPKQSSNIVLKLPIQDIGASIVWSNAYYAGIMFDKQLSEAEVTRLIAHNKSRTRSQLTHI